MRDRAGGTGYRQLLVGIWAESVILVLIQIGGLGVITVGAALALLAGRKISLKQRSTMQEASAAPQVDGIVRLTGFILRATLLFEAAGAVALMPVFCRDYGLRAFGWGCSTPFPLSAMQALTCWVQSKAPLCIPDSIRCRSAGVAGDRRADRCGRAWVLTWEGYPHPPAGSAPLPDAEQRSSWPPQAC